MTIDLVISYYKEDLDWVKKYGGFNNIYIYNKGPNVVPDIGHRYMEINLPNIGRCDHTYLYHIIQNYDSLATVTIFTTGSVDLPHKTQQFDFIFDKTFKTRDTVFYGSYYPNVKNSLYDFSLTGYNATYAKNATENQPMSLSKIRPFGPWYESHFGNLEITLLNYFGIFSVSKKHIHNHDKNHYINLIEDFPVNSNPEVGHYFERAWLAVFDPIPKECLYYNNSYLFKILKGLFILIVVCLLIFILYNIKYVKKAVANTSTYFNKLLKNIEKES